MSPEAPDKTIDASKISYPLQVVILIVAGFAGNVASTYGLRSDVRDILTRMELQQTIDAKEAAAEKERYDRLRDDVLALQREDRLRQYELKAIEVRVTNLEPKGRRP